MEKKFSLYIFDLDGTLLDSDQMLFETFRYLYKKYKPSDFVVDEARMITFSGPQIRDTIANEFPECDQEAVLKDWKEKSGMYYPILTKPYHGALELLKRLIDNEVPAAIVTNKHRSAAEKAFAAFGMEKLGFFSVCADEAGTLKPEPDGIYMCMKKFGITDKSEVLYVGDSQYDALTAKNAGVKFALVSWTPRKLGDDVNVDIVIDNFDNVRSDLR